MVNHHVFHFQKEYLLERYLTNSEHPAVLSGCLCTHLVPLSLDRTAQRFGVIPATPLATWDPVVALSPHDSCRAIISCRYGDGHTESKLCRGPFVFKRHCRLSVGSLTPEGRGVNWQPVTKRKYVCGLFCQLSRLLISVIEQQEC